MFSTKFDDLGVIIMRKRCSIQQGGGGGNDNCLSEQIPKKNRLFRLLGPPGICKLLKKSLEI